MRQFYLEERIDSNKLDKSFWFQFITATLILNPNGMDQIVGLILVKYRLNLVEFCSNVDRISIKFWSISDAINPDAVSLSDHLGATLLVWWEVTLIGSNEVIWVQVAVKILWKFDAPVEKFHNIRFNQIRSFKNQKIISLAQTVISSFDVTYL